MTVTDEKPGYPNLSQTKGKSYNCSLLNWFFKENIIIFTLVDDIFGFDVVGLVVVKKNGDIGGGW